MRADDVAERAVWFGGMAFICAGSASGRSQQKQDLKSITDAEKEERKEAKLNMFYFYGRGVKWIKRRRG